jgi:hypothetical protein
MASVGSTYLNFALWTLALAPAWLVVRQIGVTLGDRKVEREGVALPESAATRDTSGSKV